MVTDKKIRYKKIKTNDSKMRSKKKKKKGTDKMVLFLREIIKVNNPHNLHLYDLYVDHISNRKSLLLHSVN